MPWVTANPIRADLSRLFGKMDWIRKQTLFVDDALMNVEGAIKAGLKGLYLPPGIFITDIRW